jgi:hypothetical protein
LTARQLAIVPEHVASLIVHDRAPSERRGPRSYTHDGRCLEALAAPGYSVAVDAEALTAPAGRYLAERLGLSRPAFLALWTRIEVVSKLTSVPAIALLQRVRAGEPLPCTGLRLRTVAAHDLVASAGWAPECRS